MNKTQLEDLAIKIANYLYSKDSDNQFIIDGTSYKDLFEKTANEMKAVIMKYLENINRLPDSKFKQTGGLSEITTQDIIKLGNGIIRSMIPQLKEIHLKSNLMFNFQKALKIFMDRDAKDYTYSDAPTFQADLYTKFQMLFRQGSKELEFLKPNSKFNASKVAEQINSMDLNVFAGLGKYEEKNITIVAMAAQIFSGMIAKLAGIKSKFIKNATANEQQLPDDLVKTALESSIKLAQEYTKNGIILDQKQAMKIGKEIGKESRQDLYIAKTKEENNYSLLIECKIQEKISKINQKKPKKI